jgi:hypothetical protein
MVYFRLGGHCRLCDVPCKGSRQIGTRAKGRKMISPCEGCQMQSYGSIESETCRMCEARAEYERRDKEDIYIETSKILGNKSLPRTPTGLAKEIESLMAACAKVLDRLR